MLVDEVLHVVFVHDGRRVDEHGVFQSDTLKTHTENFTQLQLKHS